MSINAVPSVGSTGLAVNQARLEVAAQHIATAVSDGLNRRDAGEGGGDGAEAALRHAEQTSRQLAQDIANQRVALYHFQASVGVIKSGDAMPGALLNLSA
jgi:hypothetical protein